MSAPILLVEDDPDSQDLIRALCAAHGHAVDVAADGFLGLRLLSEHRHAVVLIDYHLPEMDGYALARLMREIVGASGSVRLVGITADRHGLASRRGADALFDAILAKPLEPEQFHATLDRLTRPTEPAPRPAADARPSHAADALWRKRGLDARPRAALCPDLGPEASAAVAQAFDLVAVEAADLVLVATDVGLESLRALRAEGPGRFLPAIDLTGRLGGACDGAFRVNDPASWDGLARTLRAFADRRAALHPGIRDAADPATRLLAALFVGERALALGACADPTAQIIETGLSRPSLMAAILSLSEDALAVCEASAGGVVVRLTEAGRAAATDGRPAARTALAAGPAPRPDGGGWRAPTVLQTTGALACAARPDADGLPILDAGRVATLRQMIGAAEVARLRANLLARLDAAFPAGASPASVEQEAHALVSIAGSLGFVRLSAACRALETALAAGADAAEASLRARQAVREARDTVHSGA
jgi:CheY-like chemotaxis protein/HPt (histidine-containing phosphotransfer) domain-containing protein